MQLEEANAATTVVVGRIELALAFGQLDGAPFQMVGEHFTNNGRRLCDGIDLRGLQFHGGPRGCLSHRSTRQTDDIANQQHTVRIGLVHLE